MATSDFEKQLIQEVRNQSRAAFDEAVRKLGTDFRTGSDTPGAADAVPLDTGFLRSRWRTANRSVTSNVLRTTVSVEAKGDNGADYAAILEKAPRIEPRKAKYLVFTPPGARGPVFSKGFKNKHYQWWTDWWGGLDSESVRWKTQIQESIERSFR